MKYIVVLILLTVSLWAKLDVTKDKVIHQFIEQIKQGDSSFEKIEEVTKYVNANYADFSENMEAFDYIIDRAGKHHLSKFSPKIRFYLSGPNNLEIFVLIKLKKEGLDNNAIADILLSASGSYAKLGKRSKEILREKGFNSRVISIIDNYTFLSSGTKTLKIKDIVLMSNNGIKTSQLSDLIIESDISHITYTKKGIEYLSSLGVEKSVLYTLVYKKILLSGPSDYTLYDIFLDYKRNKLTEATVIKKIKNVSWYYKDFSEREKAFLKKYGFTDSIINATREVTAQFNNKTQKSTQQYAQKNRENDNVGKIRFAKMKDTIMTQVSSNNSVLRGIQQNTEKKKEKSTLETVGGCAGQMLGLKACEKVPFPLSLGCSALVKNQFECNP